MSVQTIQPASRIPKGRVARKIRRNLRDHGWHRTASKILYSVMRPVFQRRTYRLYRADLTTVMVPAAPDPSFVYRFLEPHEKQYLIQIQWMEEWLDGYLEYIFQAGGECFVALDKTTVAGFNIIALHNINIPVVHYARPLRPGQAFSVQITVKNAYRGRGLGTTLRREVFRALRAQGMRQFYGGTDIHNETNLALCRKVGLREIADVHFSKLLWKERTTVRRMRA